MELERLRVTESQSSDMSIEERKRAMYEEFQLKLQISDNVDVDNLYFLHPHSYLFTFVRYLFFR